MVVLMPRLFIRAGLLTAAVCLLAGAAPHGTAQPAPQVVEITAERFSFSPSEIRVKADAPVEIRLRSDDTDHGFRLLDTDINIVIPKRGRGVATATFTPPKPGRYTFECSRLCGAGHAFMRGTLVAE
jgi:cytochrome c oxidase subunit 2